jgi:hypothetical protein
MKSGRISGSGFSSHFTPTSFRMANTAAPSLRLDSWKSNSTLHPRSSGLLSARSSFVWSFIERFVFTQPAVVKAVESWAEKFIGSLILVSSDFCVIIQYFYPAYGRNLLIRSVICLLFSALGAFILASSSSAFAARSYKIAISPFCRTLEVVSTVNSVIASNASTARLLTSNLLQVSFVDSSLLYSSETPRHTPTLQATSPIPSSIRAISQWSITDIASRYCSGAEFHPVGGEYFFANLMERANRPMLENRPETFNRVDVERATDRAQTSRFATESAFAWMNSRRGSTTSPISLVNRSSASSPSWRFT